MNFARLNHILIPSTKEARDRFRRGRFARLVAGPIARTWFSLTDEGRGLLAFSMAASLAGLDVVHGQNHLLWALCFSLIVASIAARPLLRLREVRLDVDGPSRVAVGAPARFRVRIRNEGATACSSLRLKLPFLPWDGTWTGSARGVASLAAGDQTRLEATARFVERGHHHIDPFAVAALVPLGLATGASVESRGTRFVVVPRIARVARLDLPVRPRHQQGGVLLASHTGESTELAGLRAWRDGDRIRDLHARSWARLGEPVVREYQQEYFSRVAVVVDLDAAGASERAFEAVVSLTAGILEHLMRSESLIDLLATSVASESATIGSPNPDAEPVTLGRSLGGLDQGLDRLAEMQPGHSFDPAATFAALRDRLDRVSAVVLVTLAWDGARSDLAQSVERTGAGLRAFRVADGAAPLAAADPRVRSLTATQIEAACIGATGLSL